MAVNGSSGNEDPEGKEIPDDDELDDVDRPRSIPANSGSNGARRRLPLILIGLVVIAAIALVVVVLTNGSSSKSAAPPTTTQTTDANGCTTPPAAHGPALPTGGPLANFQDQQAKFTLSYPAAWKEVKSTDPNVPLLIHIRSDTLDTVLVRVLPTQATVDTTNEASIKSFTDAVISGTKVNVLKQQPITINGLLGYYYFYALPPNPCYPNITLVHSHFFLFPPHEMLDLVFQATDTDFAPLASSFDQVINSVRATA
ncbi:MAG TPA: hypothetical protein VHT75_00360 [Acidimicrobiales bacterium]|jgi:hypothetical protein|nr:hypothetical protein [Acidimicrobiales bacterium]